MFKRIFLFTHLALSPIPGESAPSFRCLQILAQIAAPSIEDLKFGDSLQIKFTGDNLEEKFQTAHFLGRAIDDRQLSHKHTFYLPSTKTIYLFSREDIHVFNESGNFQSGNPKPHIVISKPQEGATCASYTLYNCLNLIQGRHDTPELRTTFAKHRTRKEKLDLLIRAFYDYKMSAEALLESENVSFNVLPTHDPNFNKAQAVKNALEAGHPVLVNFEIQRGKEWSSPPRTAVVNNEDLYNDRGQWRPKTPENFWQRLFLKKSDRHAVMAMDAFTDAEGKNWVLISDPNFREPSLWPLEWFNEKSVYALREILPQ